MRRGAGRSTPHRNRPCRLRRRARRRGRSYQRAMPCSSPSTASFSRVAADQDRVRHHAPAVGERDSALRADGADRTDEVLVRPHASGDAVHDDAEAPIRHVEPFALLLTRKYGRAGVGLSIAEGALTPATSCRTLSTQQTAVSAGAQGRNTNEDVEAIAAQVFGGAGELAGARASRFRSSAARSASACSTICRVRSPPPARSPPRSARRSRSTTSTSKGGVAGKYKVEPVNADFQSKADVAHQRGRAAAQPGKGRHHRSASIRAPMPCRSPPRSKQQKKILWINSAIATSVLKDKHFNYIFRPTDPFRRLWPRPAISSSPRTPRRSSARPQGPEDRADRRGRPLRHRRAAGRRAIRQGKGHADRAEGSLFGQRARPLVAGHQAASARGPT